MLFEGYLVMILLILVPIALLWLLAARYGADTRDGFDWRARSEWRES
jgi:hypothetical protein